MTKTTFEQKIDKNAEKGQLKYKYCRTLHPKERDLSSLISSSYDCQYSFVCSSGMNAIETALRSYHYRYRNHDIYCLYPNEIYPETKNLIEFYFESGLFHGIQQFDLCSMTLCEPFAHIKQQIQQVPESAEILLFVESCSNPNGYIFQFNKFLKFDKKTNITFIVDNTWLTNCIFNPFKFGADIVVESLSKYSSGGEIIAGSISTNCKIFGEFYLPHIIKICGLHVNVRDCELLRDKLPQTKDRLEESTYTLKCLLSHIQSLENVMEIYHPFLIPHPSHTIFKKINKNFVKLLPSVLTMTIRVPKGKHHFEQMIKLWEIPKMTSFGGSLGRIDPHYRFHALDCVKIRVAIGYNDFGFIKKFICFVESLKQL